MLESKVQREARLLLGQKPDLVIHRNNVGRVFDERSQNWIQYGLCPGSSDLIGMQSILITEEHVGLTIARYFAAEVKALTKLRPDQLAFIDLVNKMGGYGCVLRSVESAEEHYQRARQGLNAP